MSINRPYPSKPAWGAANLVEFIAGIKEKLKEIFVSKAGNETIGGIKTFTSSPVVPTPAADSDTAVPATTEWVNDAIDVVNGDISSLDANVVKLSGNQTVGGTKSFTSEPIVYAASPHMAFKSSDLTQASNPSANRYVYPIRFLDKNGVFLGYLEFLVGSGGNRRVGIATYKQDGTSTQLRLGFDTGGTPYITWNDKAIINGSDNQTVGGKKTFTSPIVITTTAGNATEAISASTSNGAIHINGGAGEGKGAFISLCGQDTVNDTGTFYICAKDGVNTQKNLKGKTDGTLTWAGKGFVYTSGDQTINGGLIVKGTNETQGIIIERGNPYLVFVETDWKKGTPQSSGTSYQGIQFEGSDKVAGAALFYHYGQDKNSFLEFLVNKMSASTDTASAQLFFQYPADNNIMFRPGTNNLVALGASSYRWKEIWCNQSSINTSSDERIKQQIANIPDAVLDAWGDVDWIQFKYNDSVEEKGADKARLHNGLIAQRVDGAFKAHGLEASKYGLFLYDQWDAEPEQKDENGNVTIPAQEAGDAYGLRYTEALCMEAAYQRRRADRAETRISALECRIDEMEAVLATLGGMEATE